MFERLVDGGVSDQSSLLGPHSVVVVPGRSEYFCPTVKFRVNLGKERPPIRFVDNQFHDWFSDHNEWGVVEPPMGEHELVYANTRYPAVSREIVQYIEERGGEVQISTSAIFFLMCEQADGGPGALQTNRFANVFFCVDSYGIMRVVHVYWQPGGWGVHASELQTRYENPWVTGIRVFHRFSAGISSPTCLSVARATSPQSKYAA